jgi:hypothetical protein
MAKTLRPRPSPRHGNPLQQGGSLAHPSTAGEALAFGRFRVLLRRRQLLADGVPVEIGTRAFDLLLALLDADGSLVTKEELLSRVWPGSSSVKRISSFRSRHCVRHWVLTATSSASKLAAATGSLACCARIWRRTAGAALCHQEGGLA